MESYLGNEAPATPPDGESDSRVTASRSQPPIAAAASTGPLTYEQKLDSDPSWALSEGSRHFNEQSEVFFALRKIAQRLEEFNIPYAVVGGMALFRHGLRRFTEDVKVLVTKQDLKKIHAKLEGLGYLPTHRYGKHLRDTEFKVKIEFLTTGDYPGDGKEKPVAFPEPGSVSVEIDGVKCVNLPTLIELKLASGMTAAGRLKDLSDVLELIKILNLPEDFANQLNPFVQNAYADLWKRNTRCYVSLWRKTPMPAGVKTINDMISVLKVSGNEALAGELLAMRADGVRLAYKGGFGEVYPRFVTTDPEVAKKYDMIEESELLDDGPGDGG